MMEEIIINEIEILRDVGITQYLKPSTKLRLQCLSVTGYRRLRDFGFRMITNDILDNMVRRIERGCDAVHAIDNACDQAIRESNTFNAIATKYIAETVNRVLWKKIEEESEFKYGESYRYLEGAWKCDF